MADPEYLQRAARRYEALVSSEGSIVWVVDPSLRPTGRNDHWERYTGQRPDEYFGMGWLSAIHPDDRGRFRVDTAAALASGEPLTIELGIRRADGEYRRNLIRAVPVIAGGQVIEWIGTATDIEDARQTADSLSAALAEQRDLRARLLALTEGTEHLLGLLDVAQARAEVVALAQRVLPADGYALWWFDKARAEWSVVHSVGLPAAFISQSMTGQPVTFTEPLAVVDVLAQADWSLRHQAYAEAGIRSLITVPLPIHGERRATLVMYYREPHEASDTEFRVAVALGQLSAASLGNVESYLEQTQMRHDAERHADRMAYLADASAVLGSLDYETTLREIARLAVPRMTDWCAIDIVQSDGRVERIVTAHVDPAKIELAKELERRYPSDLNAPTGVPNVLRTGLYSALIVPLVARGRTLGAITFVSASAARPLSEGDTPVLVEVGRRAALAIDNARLFNDAAAANRAKDEFLAILSHELRTPLNAIMGWAHMLRDGLPEDMAQHAVEVISRNARSQKQLVEDLLDVARIAGGKIDLERAPVDMRDVARAAVDTALPAAQQKTVALVLVAPAEPTWVFADANRLQQVAANLLSNALKFTESGGRVSVEVSCSDATVDMAVTDTGTGIAPEFLPHIFERFRQADASLTRTHGGLGLGLWVVKQIVDAHGGIVRADSEGLGKGTTIRVQLPAS